MSRNQATFENPVAEFNPHSQHPARALQAWQILIGKAMNRQTITYKGLSKLMYGKPAAGVLNKILGHVAFFCDDHDLPPLTSIVVGKGRGTPGKSIPLNFTELDSWRERTYEYDWYNVYPPSEDQLRSSYLGHGGV
ncbi:MAG: hypothetical protein HY055_00890 [Magnetospirillum sp.]|nr:hypothetical protein [Magnetospirillum sp.]